jgi:threonine dehydratase
MTPIGRDEIARMYEVVKSHIRKTPVLNVSGADVGLIDFPLTFKLESLQYAGSFKTRGAFAHLLTRDIPAAGVVAASGGNHGAAVAYAAAKLGVPATIFVPNVASPAKVERIQAYGASLRIVGERYSDALQSSEDWADATGAMPIHASIRLKPFLVRARSRSN